MKKLFTYLLFMALALVSTECKVNNLEPVPQVIENSDGSKMTIFGTPKLKENVKILSEESAEKIVINGDKIIIPINITLHQSQKNGRISADPATIKVGDVLIRGPKPEDSEEATPIQIDAETKTIKVGSETVSVEFSFHKLSDATDVFTDFSGIFETTFNIALNKNINLSGSKEWKSRTDDPTTKSYQYSINSTLPFPLQIEGGLTYNVTRAVTIKNNVLEKAGIIERFNIKGGVSFDLKGSLVAANILQTIIKSAPYQYSRIFILPGGVPIVLGFGYEVNFKSSLNIEGEISGSDKVLSFEREYVCAAFKDISKVPQEWSNSYEVSKNDTDNSNKKSVALKGKLQMGFEFKPNIYFFSEKFLRAEISLYPNAVYDLDAKCENGDAMLTGNMQANADISGAVVLEALNIKINIKTINIPGDKYEFLKKTINKYAPCSYTQVTNDLSLTFFKQYLMTNKFPIYQSNNPPTIQGDFESNTNLHLIDSFNQEQNSKFYQKYGRALHRIDTKSKILEVIQYDNAANSQAISNESALNIIEVLGNNDGEFTLFAKTDGQYNDRGTNRFKNYIAISGKLTTSGIQNFHYAFYRIESSLSFREDIPIGGIRIFKDGDGIATKL